MNLPHTFAILDGLSGMELMTVAFVALMLFGGKKLPSLARSAGRTMREIKKVSGEFEREFKRAVDEALPEDPLQPAKPVRAIPQHLPPKPDFLQNEGSEQTPPVPPSPASGSPSLPAGPASGSPAAGAPDPKRPVDPQGS